MSYDLRIAVKADGKRLPSTLPDAILRLLYKRPKRFLKMKELL